MAAQADAGKPMTNATGQCLCGAVTFTADHVESNYHACHCSMCRRWTGSPLFGVSADGVAFNGEENLTRFPSSEHAERGFCSKCGSNLFYFFTPTGNYFMCVGAFDDPSIFELKGEIYVDHQPEGYAFAGDLSRLTEAEFLAKFTPAED